MLGQRRRIRQTAFLLVLLSSMVAATCSAAEETPEGISPAVRTYLEQALDLMQKNALNSKSIDWTQVRRETLVRAKDAKTTFDTYPAMAYALTQLKENHSWLELPDNLPVERRQALEAEISRVLARPQPAKPSPFAPSHEIKGHMDRRAGKVF